ncbi:MAG: thiamine pyrophosphate-binding protein, partial [Sedimenticolaceae bacterium]
MQSTLDIGVAGCPSAVCPPDPASPWVRVPVPQTYANRYNPRPRVGMAVSCRASQRPARPDRDQTQYRRCLHRAQQRIDMKVTVSDIVVRYMERLGIEFVFGMPGAHVLPIYDRLYSSAVKTILVKHEQGASFMAGGYA